MAVNIKTNLHFVPFDVNLEPLRGTADLYQRASDKRPVEIHDVRGHERDFTLDIHGFEYIIHRSAHLPTQDKYRIKEHMYPEAAELVKKQTGATRVEAVSHSIRNNLSDADSEYTGLVGPAHVAHLDHTYSGAHRYLREKLPKEADRLSKTRWAIVNVWRPLKPVRRDPLAVCDGASVQSNDLIEILADFSTNPRAKKDTLLMTVAWEISVAKYHPHQRWHYMSNMTPDDVVLFKNFDTRTRKSKTALHTAFEDPASMHVLEPRESIEIRTLVFFEDQQLEEDF